MRKSILCLLACLYLLGLVPVLAQDEPKFEEDECWFNIPQGLDIECGYVEVPESRNPQRADEDNTIALAVAVVHSTSRNPLNDPVIYLDGGPGGYTLISGDFYAVSFAGFLAERDVILFDQRGVGFSEPALDCPQVTEVSYETLDGDPSEDEAIELYDEAYTDCREDLIDDGVNITAYNSAENAADVRDIITALGYEQVNLLGVSYGTRLALTIMRDHPDIVRSAVLDAVYPPNAHRESEFITNLDRVFTTLFEGCAAEPTCDNQYPDLETVFYDTVDRLNEAPELIEYYDPYTGREVEVLVTGDLLISGLFSMLYSTNNIPFLPRYIYDAADGTYDAFIEDKLLNLASDQFFSIGFYYAVECYEEVPHDSYEATIANSEGLPPQLVDYWLGYEEDESLFAFCETWTDGERADEIEDQPVESDIPTLIVVGEYDPITPPEWSQRAAETLSNSYYYQFPGVGHSVWFGGGRCGTTLISSFIANPFTEPNATCINLFRSPFAPPLEISSITLTSHENATFDFVGVVPEGWEEIEAGVFSPDPQFGLPTFAYRFPPSLEEYTERILFGAVYQLNELPNPEQTIESANGLVWHTYEVDAADNSVYSFFAFTEAEDGTAYVIAIVGTSPEQRELLYDQLLIPAVKAFVPLSE